MPSTSIVLDVLDVCPPGITAPCGMLSNTFSVEVDYNGTDSEFSGNTFPRYPMTMTIDTTGGVLKGMKFFTLDGVQESFTKKTYTFRSAWDFNSGVVLPSAQGGTLRGLTLLQRLDNAKYPWFAEGFDPSQIASWTDLYSTPFVEIDGAWWNSIAASGSDPVDALGFTITLVDGSGFKEEYAVYFEMYTAPVVPMTTDFTYLVSDVTGGSDVVFTPSVVGGTAPYTYIWDYDDGSPLEISDEPTHFYDDERQSSGTTNPVLTTVSSDLLVATATHQLAW